MKYFYKDTHGKVTYYDKPQGRTWKPTIWKECKKCLNQPDSFFACMMCQESWVNGRWLPFFIPKQQTLDKWVK